MKKIIIYLLFIITIPSANYGQNGSLEEWKKFSVKKNSAELISLLKKQASFYLNNTEEIKGNISALSSPPFYGKLGLFITIIKKGKVRGCYGSFSHRSDSIEDVLNEYLIAALKSDPRHRPIEAEELDSADIILTVADQPVSVNELDSADLKKKGVLITFENGEKTVYVPAEIRTASYIKKEIRGREYQAEIFNTVTVRKSR